MYNAFKALFAAGLLLSAVQVQAQTQGCCEVHYIVNGYYTCNGKAQMDCKIRTSFIQETFRTGYECKGGQCKKLIPTTPFEELLELYELELEAEVALLASQQ